MPVVPKSASSELATASIRLIDNSSVRVPLSKLEIGMLKALDTLLRERSVSGAARLLGVSQPSMSNALSRLRQVFDDPLLIRSGQSMVLTNYALQLTERVAAIVEDLASLEQKQTFVPSTSAMTFRIGVTDHSAAVMMPAVLLLLRAEAPNVRLMTLPIDGSFREVENVNSNTLHLRMHWVRDAPPDWHIRKLLTETMVVIGRKGHPDLLSPLSLERFLELDQVAPSPNRSGFQTRADLELGQLGYKRRVVVSLAHFASLPPVVRQTDLIALFPRRLIRALNLEDELEVAESPIAFDNFSTSLAWHPRYHHDPAHRWLRDLIGRAALTQN